MTDFPYCEHNRLPGACEVCAFEAAQARGALDGTRPTLYPAGAAPRPVAEADLDIATGEDATVHVKAGDPIPADLIDAGIDAGVIPATADQPAATTPAVPSSAATDPGRAVVNSDSAPAPAARTAPTAPAGQRGGKAPGSAAPSTDAASAGG